MIRPLLLTLLLLIGATSFAQINKRREAYDSLIVGDVITPAVSSVMMPKGFTEVILYNGMLTANRYYNENREKTEYSPTSRATYLISTLQVTHGLSNSGRFNVGLDLTYRTGRVDADPKSSPLKVLGNASDGLIQYGRAFTSIAVRARYVPLAEHKNFVIQHSFSIPLGTAGRDATFLGDNRYAINTQFLYNHLVGRKLFLFGQMDALVRLEDSRTKTDITNPINAYASYLMTKHFFPFALIGMTNFWNNKFDHLSQSFTYGVGVQCQFNSMFTINAFYNDVFAGKTAAQWKGFNLGIRKVL
jgi:hypothetical protein